MQFELKTTQAKLFALLQTVAGVVRNSSTLPVLANVLLKTQPNGEIRVIGSDLEIEVSAEREIGTFTGKLNTTLEFKKLQEILQTMAPSEPVILSSTSTDRVVVSGNNSKFNLSCIDAKDFPIFESPAAYTDWVTIPQKALKALFEKTGFAMAKHDVRYYLVGTYLRTEADRLAAYCTDGHRLATDMAPVDIKQADGVNGKLEVILSRKTVLELKRLLGNEDTLVDLQFGTNLGRAKFGDVTVVMKLIEGKFPDVNQVIPKGNKNLVSVNLPRLLLTMQQAAILTSSKFNGVRFMVERELIGGRIKVEASNEKKEEVKLDLNVEYTGDPVDTGFNVKYLLDALPTMDADEVTFAFGSDSKGPGAALLTLPGHEWFKYVVMPLRV